MSLVACEASFHPLHPYPLNTQHHKRMYLACICTTVLPCSFCWVRASVCFNLLARGQSLISQPMALSLRWFLCTMLTARMRAEDPAVLFHHNPQGPLSLIPSSCTYMWNGDISSCRGCSFFFWLLVLVNRSSSSRNITYILHTAHLPGCLTVTSY